MGFAEFMDAQARNAGSLGNAPHFASLVPLVDQMYLAAIALAAERYSPTLVKVLMVCHREFLVAASQIQRGLAFDSHANTRRAVEAAKVALAVKRNFENVDEWLKPDIRQRRWDARQQGQKPEYLPPTAFRELAGDPLIASLQEYFGIASDMYVHFTPEFFGQQTFTETSTDGESVSVALSYFAAERDVLLHAVMLCGVHVRILLVFDAVFDNVVTGDRAWRLLRATFDQLGAELMREIPPSAS